MFEPYVKHLPMSPIHFHGPPGCFFLPRETACHRHLRQTVNQADSASASRAPPEPSGFLTRICLVER
jgi:hypothetical protein